MKELFHRFSARVADASGSPWTFAAALLVVVIWLALGPVYHYSDTWQLTINTASSIIPTLMVFVIQNTQNRDTRALHLKLDELLRSVGGRPAFMELESLSDAELQTLEREFLRLRQARAPQPPPDRAGN